jgi:hypothetical protein
MSTIQYPDDFEVDYHADLLWHRQQRALRKISLADVLAVIDETIAAEPDPTQHPLHGLVAYLLEKSNTPGDPHALYERCKRLADHAIEACVEAVLSDPHAWEVD